MKSRKEVLAQIRQHVLIKSYGTFSEPRKDHQRVKWYGCDANVENIQRVLNMYGHYDVVVEHHETRWVDSIVLRFPFENYN